MLTHLLIENYALIQKLDTGFSEGLTVITGETGAGKSILLGALSLILGQRADTRVLKDKSRKCIIEGSFSLSGIPIRDVFDSLDLDYDELSWFRREITPQGKSRAFINDTPVTLQVMRTLSERLIDIHSQHQSLLLGNSAFAYNVLDSYAGHIDTVNAFRAGYNQYQLLQQELRQSEEAEKSARADLDYYHYQLDELKKALPTPEEYRQMLEEAEIYRHAEEISHRLEKSVFLLQYAEPNLADTLNEIISLIRPLGRLNKAYDELASRLNSVLIESRDVASEAESLKDAVVHDPEQAALLEAKLDQVNKLLFKHHASDIDDLLATRDAFSLKIAGAVSLEEKIRELRKKVVEAEGDLQKQAEALSSARSRAIPAMEKEISEMLNELGMPGARFRVRREAAGKLPLHGTDRLDFLFTANTGATPREVSRVASGGELSRLMLSFKSMISRKNLLPTIIFDEIDTGISGETSHRVAHILHRMSHHMQVVAITHLPQIAARGTDHLLVYKTVEDGKTNTHIRKLTSDERIAEVARMLGGEKPTKAMEESAKELILNKLNN